MNRDSMSYEDAIEFYDFNIDRAIDYMGDNKPIIMYSIEGTY
jgi:hypothetical protein